MVALLAVCDGVLSHLHIVCACGVVCSAQIEVAFIFMWIAYVNLFFASVLHESSAHPLAWFIPPSTGKGMSPFASLFLQRGRGRGGDDDNHSHSNVSADVEALTFDGRGEDEEDSEVGVGGGVRVVGHGQERREDEDAAATLRYLDDDDDGGGETGPTVVVV